MTTKAIVKEIHALRVRLKKINTTEAYMLDEALRGVVYEHHWRCAKEDQRQYFAKLEAEQKTEK